MAIFKVNFSEAVGYITHLTKIIFNLCQMETFKDRVKMNEKTLVDLYKPNFACDTRLGTISNRLQTCHNHYYRSFTGGIPGLTVSFFSLTLSVSLTIVCRSVIDFYFRLTVVSI